MSNLSQREISDLPRDPNKFFVKHNKALPISQDLSQGKTERKCFNYGKNIKGTAKGICKHSAIYDHNRHLGKLHNRTSSLNIFPVGGDGIHAFGAHTVSAHGSMVIKRKSQIVLALQALFLTGWICFYTKFFGAPNRYSNFVLH